jgi:hypothetical protein
MYIPKVHYEFQQHWKQHQNELVQQYTNTQNTFIPNLLPEQAVQLSTIDTLKILNQKLDSNIFAACLSNENTIPSPIQQETNSNWLKQVNMVGINVRTIGSFWNIVKYMLTIPNAQSSVHILPIWEVGVVASLYGISSWNINPEFFDEELCQTFPTLDTVEKQLKVSINFLHAMGKIVGMDVIPHTDRYSQVVLANPHYFEWLRRDDLKIIDHKADLHLEVQERIIDFLNKNGNATDIDIPKTSNQFFNQYTEDERLLALFGEKRDYKGRLKRRNALVQHLYNHGYEPVPATMAPPYRGLAVSADENAKVVDDDGRVWRDYIITKPEPMSRVFGPLTRFKLYERLNDNQEWEIDFTKPRKAVWKYVANQYLSIQQAFNFDFMRGDMSHVQMRSDGVPKVIGNYYDILKTIKNHIQTKVPYFGYFAETFIAPAGHMAYGDEIDHLEASEADTTLGDLQSVSSETPEFQQRLRQYYDILQTRQVTPNFTMMTGDKDDPRFDKFYIHNNEARYFMGLFLGDMPSYMALGFQCRDTHLEPAPNEHYTKLYVFQIDKGSKATHSNYIWGKNGHLYHNLTRIKLYADMMIKEIHGLSTRWLLPPDATGYRKVMVWTQFELSQYVFVVNLNTQPIKAIKIPQLDTKRSLVFEFSTCGDILEVDKILNFNGVNYHLDSLQAGECRVYKINS